MDNVDSINERRFCGGLAGFSHRFLAGLDLESALVVGQIDLAVQQRQFHPAVAGHRDVKFRSPNGPRGRGRAELGFRRLVAIEKIGGAGFQIKDRAASRLFGRLDFQRGQFVNAQHAQSGKLQSRPAVFPGAKTTPHMKDLIGLRWHPGGGACGRYFDHALACNQADIIRGLICGSSIAFSSASRTIFLISSSFNPLDVSIRIDCSLPVALSFADTWTIPLASISKVTSICGIPRGAGGIPTKSNRPKVLLSPAIGRSPCRT